MDGVILMVALGAVALGFADQDTVEVVATEPPVWGTVSLFEQWRIGSIAGDEATAFGLIADVEEGCDGSVWVVDRLLPALRVLDETTGEPIRKIGREGRGPGEFIQTSGIERLDDCRIALYDHALGRLTFFDSRSGEVVDTRALPGSGAMRSGKMAQYVENGRLYTWTRVGPRDDRRAAWIGYPVDSSPGTTSDTIVLPPTRPEGSVFTTSNGAPFTVETIASLTPIGLIWGRNDEYQVYRRVRNGTVQKIVRPIQPEPLLPEERDQWEAMAERVREEGSHIPGTRVADLPGEKPFFSSIGADHEGRIWVRRYVRAVEGVGSDGQTRWREPPVYDVLSRDGELLGEVSLKLGQSLLAVWDNSVYVVEKGEYDEQYLLKYSLVFE